MALIDTELQESTGRAVLARQRVRSVAVFRALQLGDMLCAVPALRALRGALPAARITLIGLPWAEQFAARFHRYVDDFIPFPGHPAFPEQPYREDQIPGFFQTVHARNFDLALQMHGSGQVSNQIIGTFGAEAVAGCAAAGSGADPDCFVDYPETGPEPLRLLKLTEFLGAPTLGTHLEFPITAEDQRELAESGLAAGAEPGRYICIHPGARFRDKCWSPSRFAEVADSLADEFGVSVVLTGSAKEGDLTAEVASHMKHKAIDAAGPISIGAMAALMRDARLLVCNDTGVSHIAAGLRLPSVVVFSKADIQRWAPLDQDLHRCLWDPEGQQAQTVAAQARALLSRSATVGQAARD
ncbi:MAG TPA: glycosyltransferase family 9 protein [Noviherbaspirillum sp.]|jgi:ADP-heptose:LPS heptosyltransferase|uniref:glycosyltransferase family 9 protein n=1 Tax=Noviherbaspirillum sp. TaxID=1926288 RepID=UPI002F92F938